MTYFYWCSNLFRLLLASVGDFIVGFSCFFGESSAGIEIVLCRIVDSVFFVLINWDLCRIHLVLFILLFIKRAVVVRMSRKRMIVMITIGEENVVTLSL